jgi:large subunit ribosomal protein L25
MEDVAMKDLLIEVSPRESFGKNESRRMRRAGKIPAILYGAGKDPVPLIVDPVQIERILHSESGANTLFRLGLAGTEKQRHVMIKDYQVDPVKGQLMHADFVRIRMDEVIEVSVPVRIIGEAVGVKLDGGILEHVTRSVDISCLPTNIPEHIDIDVTNLKIGDSIKVSDVQATDQYTMLTEAGQTLVVCAAPAKEETPEATVEAGEATATAPAEPEVLKKGKAEPEEDKESK